MKHHGYLQLNVVFFLVFLAGKIMKNPIRSFKRSGFSWDKKSRSPKNPGVLGLDAGRRPPYSGASSPSFCCWENSPNQNLGNLKLPGDGDDGRFKMTSRQGERKSHRYDKNVAERKKSQIQIVRIRKKKIIKLKKDSQNSQKRNTKSQKERDEERT